jgi:hypothetical protein
MMPKFPALKELSKLSRAEITERLQSFGLKWTVFREYEDVDDPFLTKPTEKQLTRQEQEYIANVYALHRAPIFAWIETLTAHQIEKVAKAYKINFTPWQRRSASIADLRRELYFRLPQVP